MASPEARRQLAKKVDGASPGSTPTWSPRSSCSENAIVTKTLDYKEFLTDLARCVFYIWLMWFVCVPIAIILALVTTGEITWETILGQRHKILPDVSIKYIAAKKTLYCYYVQVTSRLAPALQNIAQNIEKQVISLRCAAYKIYLQYHHAAMMRISHIKAKFGMIVGHLHQVERSLLVNVKAQEETLIAKWDRALIRQDVIGAIETKIEIMNLSLTHREAFKALDCAENCSYAEYVKTHCSMTQIKALHQKHGQLINKFAEDPASPEVQEFKGGWSRTVCSPRKA